MFNIKEKFLELTARTYPYGFEDGLISTLPSDTQLDTDGNYFYQIGESKTIFACHLDTACKAQVDITHTFNGELIKTDGKSILGADDKAGMTILLWLIAHNIPGLYYFFIGEEVGCIGSRAAAQRQDYFSKYDRMISFDRRGTTSVITYQSSSRTCSDNFAKALASEINKGGLWLSPDDTGVYTDSAEFAHIIPECTNISVGYYQEHTHNESQDIKYLETLCHALLNIDFEQLPVSRDPNKQDYKSWSWGSKSYGYCESGWYDDSTTRESRKKTRRGGRRQTMWNKNGDSWIKEDLNFGHDLTSQPDYYYVDGKKVYYDRRVKLPLQTPTTDKKDYYVFLRDQYLNSNISSEEFKIIKNDFLDSQSEEDQQFADWLTELIA